MSFFSLQFLQNLGKVDRTADDIFDEHLQNFTRQQNSANRLQKEFNNYIRCVRGTSFYKINRLLILFFKSQKTLFIRYSIFIICNSLYAARVVERKLSSNRSRNVNIEILHVL